MLRCGVPPHEPLVSHRDSLTDVPNRANNNPFSLFTPLRIVGFTATVYLSRREKETGNTRA